MVALKDAAAQFLAHQRIAVTGVSRTPQAHGGNVIYRRLRARGYEVFAVNPNADEVEGDKCYHALRDIPGGVDAVVMATSPEGTSETMRECADLGIKCVWQHGPVFGPGSVCSEATAYGRAHGMLVIDGGCPLMFKPTADVGHRIMRAFGSGKLPEQV
jgi:predicted CoA-binding protein